MTLPRYAAIVVAVLLALGLSGGALAQTQTQTQPAKTKCGPDHAILYKRAVGLLDTAEKKLNARYTAEAKSLVKESNSLFTILQKECGQQQKDRLLTDKEAQQEAINQKLCADERSSADRLMKSAEDKEKKAQQLEGSQKDLSLKYEREAKEEYEQAQKRYIKSAIYALRTQQMLFSFLGK
jgi:DNA anti-recombination protein RmuC